MKSLSLNGQLKIIIKPLCLMVFIVAVNTVDFFWQNLTFIIVKAMFIWVLGVFVIPRSNVVAKFYLIIFGMFFVLPIVMLGEDYLFQGASLKSIVLDRDEAIATLKIIFIFVSIFLIVSAVLPALKDGGLASNKRLTRKLLYSFFLFSTGIYVIYFNLLEAFAIYGSSYMDYHNGTLSVQKGFVTLIVEIIFLVLCSVGLVVKSKTSLFLMILYVISLILTGIRMPAVTLGFFYCLYFFPVLRKNIFIVVCAMLLVAPPILMFTQALRVYGFGVFEYFDFWGGYLDLFKVLGYTIDTLKAAVYIEVDLNVTVFFRVLDILSVFLDRVLGVTFIFEGGAYGHRVTEMLAPEIYAVGGTVGSSSLAESWYYGGWFGIVLLSIFSALVCYLFSTLIRINSLVGAFVFIVFVPKFIISIRNEVFGWAFEGVIYFALASIFIAIFGKIFIVRAK